MVEGKRKLIAKVVEEDLEESKGDLRFKRTVLIDAKNQAGCENQTIDTQTYRSNSSDGESRGTENSIESQYDQAKRMLLGDIVPAEQDSYPCFDSVKCLLFYSLCCCVCYSNKVASKSTKASFMQRFSKWMHLNKKDDSEDSKLGAVKALMRLYAHQSDAIKDLKELCRVNPDFTSQFRNDLEFYVPQICTFFLKGDLEDPQQLFDFLLMASSADFFFAHRVWFFLNSSMLRGMSPETIVTAQKVIRGLKCLQMSPQGNPAEILFLANSKDIMRLLNDLNLSGQYPHLHELTNSFKLQFQELSAATSSNSSSSHRSGLRNELMAESQRDRCTKARKLIHQHTLQALHHAEAEYTELKNQEELFEQAEGEKEEKKANIRSSFATSNGSLRRSRQGPTMQINAKDVVLRPFSFSFEEESSFVASVARISDPLRRTKLQAFLSTPCFIQSLTDISHKLSFMQATPEEKRLELIRDLTEVNENLPARVYIPFVNESMRNYAVLHIAALESRIFQTKSRAPVLLCIEVYRPDELAEHVPEPQKKPAPATSPKKKNLLSNFKNKIFAEKNQNSSDVPRRVSSNLTMKDKLTNLLSSKKKKSSNHDVLSKGSSQGRSDRSDSEVIDKMADLKVSNPLFIGDSKLTKHSFIRHVKAESQAHPKTPFHGHTKGIFFPQSGNKAPLQQSSKTQNSSNTSDGVISTYDQAMMPSKLLSVRKLSQESEDQGSSFLRHAPSDETENNIPMRMASQQHQITHRLFENLAAESESQQSSQNAIEKLNLLEEDDESEWTEVPRTVYDREKQSDIEESKGGFRIQQIESEESDASSCSSGESDGDDSKQKRDATFGRNNTKDLKLLSGSQTSRLAEMLKKSNPGDISQLAYRERDLSQIFNESEENQQSKRLLDTESDEEEEEKDRETAAGQEIRIRAESPFGHLKSWRLLRVIVKANDDVRQEQFAMQLISQIYQIFKLKKLNLWMKPYEILATGPNCGLLEFVADTMSVDEIHRKHGTELYQFFVNKFGRGNPKSKLFKKAQNAFCQSLAAYSLVCYVLQIKDRHNQNILIDGEGHIVHIDFGFLLSSFPGQGLKFEKAPFKLTQEFIEVLGGEKSKKFKKFRKYLQTGFMALQEHADKIIILVEMMVMGQGDLPCFEQGEETIRIMKENLFPDGRRFTAQESLKFTDWLINQSVNNWRTIWYDRVQYCCQGIL